MSYILQALKKAEAERGLGQVPGLDAPAPATVVHGPSDRHVGAWLAGGGALGLAVLAGWWWTAAPTSVQTASSVPTPAVAAAAPAVVPEPMPAPTPAPTLPLPAPPRTLTPPAPPKPAAALEPQPWPSTPGWPTLTLGGSVYSDMPGARMLIINGQVLREGDAASADLSVVRIGAKSAVLRYKGSTYLWRY